MKLSNRLENYEQPNVKSSGEMMQKKRKWDPGTKSKKDIRISNQNNINFSLFKNLLLLINRLNSRFLNTSNPKEDSEHSFVMIWCLEKFVSNVSFNHVIGLPWNANIYSEVKLVWLSKLDLKSLLHVTSK